MKSILLNQEKTIKQKLFGSVFIVCAAVSFLVGESYIAVFVFILVGLVFFGFNLKYKIESAFEKSETQYCVFNIKLFSRRLNFPFPDYISVFSTTLKGSNEYSTVSALGRNSRHDKMVLKLFKDHKNIIIYTANSYDDALDRAHFIKDILNIELYNPLED